jgi:hypothetical protein
VSSNVETNPLSPVVVVGATQHTKIVDDNQPWSCWLQRNSEKRQTLNANVLKNSKVSGVLIAQILLFSRSNTQSSCQCVWFICYKTVDTQWEISCHIPFAMLIDLPTMYCQFFPWLGVVVHQIWWCSSCLCLDFKSSHFAGFSFYI